MPMVTRCPACTTVFRVTPQQLQAHQGQVRCGRCMTVFDGFGTLATLPDQQPEEPAAKLPASFANDGGAHAAAENTSSARPPGPEEPSAIGNAMAAGPAAGLPASEAADSAGASDTAVQTAELDRPLDLDALHEPQEQLHGKGRARGSRAWAAAAALMLLALAVQAAYAYRGELVANYPGLKPIFARLCDLAGCTVPLLQRPQLIVIEASDLQVEDPLRPGVIQLTATLRNHAGYEVGYPALDLVLTNTKQHALARRIFLPAEYLEKRASETGGLAAHAEVTIRLVLDTGDLGAAGFRLALLPARP
jgi:predicted Zn finger-like uncharacterized protein